MKMMHRAMTVVAVALACLVVVEPAAAEIQRPAFFDRTKLDEACGDGTAFDAGLCYGYVFGVADSAETVQFVNGQRMWCWPNELTVDQAMDQSVSAVKLYLRDHRENRHLSGASLVAAALKEKFPCN
jgi:hypothetical protein